MYEEGLEDGIEKGRVAGRQEGRQEGYQDVALNLLKKGVDSKVILDSTGLSEKELEDLKNKQK